MGLKEFLCRSGVYKGDLAQANRFLLMLETRECITLLFSPSPTSRDITFERHFQQRLSARPHVASTLATQLSSVR